jgi:cytochrome b561
VQPGRDGARSGKVTVVDAEDIPVADGRYPGAFRLLHWIMAALIVATWCLGYYSSILSYPAQGAVKFQTIFIHKTIGFVVLLLLVVRMLARLRGAAPAWPATMTRFEQIAATTGHGVLYALMLAVPLTGILYSGSHGYGIPVLGLFQIPPPFAKDAAILTAIGRVHLWLTWVFLLVVCGHVAMVSKHRVVDKDGIFRRMAFGRR